MDDPRWVPGHLAENARAHAERGAEPAPARDASTVVLVRDGDGEPGGLEVYLLRRTPAMAFAAGFCVFPGGRVDPRDSDHEVGWSGPDVAEWADALGVDAQQARALVCAAVRETFEESGVLLAGASAGEVVADTTSAQWESDRHALESRRLALTDLLDRRGLVLRTDLLAYWGAWITPEAEPRRYDTRFFVAGLPAGQVTRDVSSESDAVLWLPVREALDAVDEGRLSMLPPTYVTCLELFEHRSVVEAMASAADRDRSAVMPSMRLEGDDATLRLPPRTQETVRRVQALRGRA